MFKIIAMATIVLLCGCNKKSIVEDVIHDEEQLIEDIIEDIVD